MVLQILRLDSLDLKTFANHFMDYTAFCLAPPILTVICWYLTKIGNLAAYLEDCRVSYRGPVFILSVILAFYGGIAFLNAQLLLDTVFGLVILLALSLWNAVLYFVFFVIFDFVIIAYTHKCQRVLAKGGAISTTDVLDIKEAYAVLNSVLGFPFLFVFSCNQGWKFMSCSHCQELGQQASWLLIDWLHKSEH